MISKSTTVILKNLRNVMKNTKYCCPILEAYIIPSCDAHQSEYVASCDKRREYVSGFTGSVGTAIVTGNRAALWTDGRYHNQAAQELDENWILMKDGNKETPTFGQFLIDVLPSGSYVGVDPFLNSFQVWITLEKQLKIRGITLMPVEKNLVDAIWEDQPFRPSKEIECLSLEYTGRCWQEKILDLQKELQSEKASAIVLTSLDEIAWLFNLRGSDVPYNPVFFSYAVITLNSVYLFLDAEKLTLSTRASLEDTSQVNVNLKICSYEGVINIIQEVVNRKEGLIWICDNSSYALVSHIPEEMRLLKMTPIELNKAIKNEKELQASRSAHLKDAVALCEYFCWLSQNVQRIKVTEIDAVKKLEEIKRTQKYYVGPSFETISCSGPNASIIHYLPSLESNRKLSNEEMYLCDCGSQYRDGGTTDVTRTFHFGTPSSFDKVCYTLVLKGHIALSSAVFPKFTQGIRLDTFARQALWESGLDYMHGTGHGVGAFLNVHEGPVKVSYRISPDDPGVQAGMILSIEPGFYQDGEFGIRLENLAYVKPIKTPHNFQNTEFLTFEPLTLVPFQTKLIDPSLLNLKEVKWLNDYHSTCRDLVGKVLEEEGKTEAFQWLLKETQPLG